MNSERAAALIQWLRECAEWAEAQIQPVDPNAAPGDSGNNSPPPPPPHG